MRSLAMICATAVVAVSCSTSADPGRSTTVPTVGSTTSSSSPVQTTAGATTTSVFTQSAPSTGEFATLDDLLTAWARQEAPIGVTALLTGTDGALWSGSAGDPDATIDGLYQIGSITKTLVSTTALLLAAEGAFDLDAPVSSYAPALAPSEGATMRELLSHTAGMVDGDFDFSINTLLELDRVYAPAELIEPALAATRGPAGVYRYANSGYWLAGGVIEAVTGEPLEAVMRRLVLEPLDMAETYLAWAEAPPEPLVPGYVAFGQDTTELPIGVEPLPAMVTGAWSAGGTVSTAADVTTFYRALFDGALLDATQLEALLTVPNGSAYGLGIERRTTNGLDAWGHNGAIPGYRSSVIHDPATGLTVVVFANRLRTDLDTEPLSAQLLAAAIEALG